jgi:hypothetical protein
MNLRMVRRAKGGRVGITPSGGVKVECDNGHVDWPLLGQDGTITWDFPERVPQTVKAAVVELLREV